MCGVCGCSHTHDDGLEHGHTHDDPSVEHGSHEHEGVGPDHTHDEHAGGHGHTHDHGGGHEGAGRGWTHDHGVSPSSVIRIEQDLLAQNDRFADRNRAWLKHRQVLGINMVSSPGAGKTTLLAKTISMLEGRWPLAVIVGDQQTSRDADRLRETGVQAHQINTGRGCHLDAHMIDHALMAIEMPDRGILFIENVGNLVCPADFDLGEALRVVLLSVTEGEDKPIKYANIFAKADLMLLTKVDLLPYVDFREEECLELARRVNPRLACLRLSARTGEGMETWLSWLEEAHAKH